MLEGWTSPHFNNPNEMESRSPSALVFTLTEEDLERYGIGNLHMLDDITQSITRSIAESTGRISRETRERIELLGNGVARIMSDLGVTDVSVNPGNKFSESALQNPTCPVGNNLSTVSTSVENALYLSEDGYQVPWMDWWLGAAGITSPNAEWELVHYSLPGAPSSEFYAYVCKSVTGDDETWVWAVDINPFIQFANGQQVADGRIYYASQAQPSMPEATPTWQPPPTENIPPTMTASLPPPPPPTMTASPVPPAAVIIEASPTTGVQQVWTQPEATSIPLGQRIEDFTSRPGWHILAMLGCLTFIIVGCGGFMVITSPRWRR